MDQSKEPIVYCQWFALCENPATDAEPHPVLGDVPVCERCKAIVAANR